VNGEEPWGLPDLLGVVLDAIPLAAMVLTPGYRIVMANRATVELSGEGEPVSGDLKCYELSHRCDLPCNGPGESCPLNQVVATKSPVRQIHRVHDGQGLERLTEVSAAPLFDAAGNVTHVLGILRDVTDRAPAGERESRHSRSAFLEERVRRLGGLVEAYKQSELRDRKRLALVLREELQQLLFVAVLKLGHLQREIGTGSELEEDVRQLAELIRQTMELSRSVITELCPPVVFAGSMAEILEWLASWMRNTHDLETEIDVEEGADPASEEARMFLFEAVRELLLNVVTHAKARRARVQMKRCGEREMQIVVIDEGIGFAPPRWEKDEVPAGRVGLLGIRERVRLMGGRMDIVSSPGRGSRITLTLPR